MFTKPDSLLRVEALFVLLAALTCFAQLHGHWWFFALLFLAPDLTLLGYLARNSMRFAATLYNAGHSYMGPLLMGLLAGKFGAVLYEQLAAIWIAHIAVDRLLGFGLKFPQAFKPTHIQSAGIYPSTPA